MYWIGTGHTAPHGGNPEEPILCSQLRRQIREYSTSMFGLTRGIALLMWGGGLPTALLVYSGPWSCKS